MEYNPRKDEKVYLGTRLLDSIEGGVIGTTQWLQKQAEENPDTYTDDVLRLLGGGIKNTAWAISKIPLLDKLAQGEDWLAGQARALNEQLTPWLDPRFAGWGTRIGTGILADKGARKVLSGIRGVNLLDELSPSVGAARFGKLSPSSGDIQGIENALNPQRLARIKNLKQDLLRQVVGDIPTDPATGTALKVRRYVSKEQANKVRYRMGQISPDMKGGKFIYNSYEAAKGPWTPTYRRLVIEDFLTPGFYKRGFSGTAATLTGEFKSRYAPFLEAAGISPGDVQLHHIMALADSIPLYDGLIYNSKEWWDLTEFLLKRAIRPGAWEFGGKMNYKVVIGQAKQKTGPTRSAHGVTHLFYDHKLRPKGGKNFWRKSELKKMNDNPRYRYKKAEEFARIVKRSEIITDQAMDTYELLNPGTVWTDELTETFLDKLGKLDERGLLPERIMKEEYQIPKMQELVQKISDELDVIGSAGKMSDDQFLDMLRSFDGESVQLLRELFGGEVKINTGIKVNLKDPLVQRAIIRSIKKGNPDINPGQINIITNKIKKKFPPKKKGFGSS
tara:strand:+ start:956 stop:2632 length:1677 start_codon:yes stop_codon:yes gene_type:complete